MELSKIKSKKQANKNKKNKSHLRQPLVTLRRNEGDTFENKLTRPESDVRDSDWNWATRIRHTYIHKIQKGK